MSAVSYWGAAHSVNTHIPASLYTSYLDLPTNLCKFVIDVSYPTSITFERASLSLNNDGLHDSDF